MSKLFQAMLIIVIGLALLPTVISSVDALDTAGLSTAVQGLVDLLPILYMVVIVGGAIGYAKFGG